ncbi:MAG: neutral zinc metallopeptidase [Thermoanaerobaculia bacterium]
MRWTPGGISRDIIDRRGGGGGLKLGGGLGCGGIIILLVLSLVTGQNFFQFFDGAGGPAQGPGQAAPPTTETPQERERLEFVSFVLDDAQNTWTRVFQEQHGSAYERAKLSPFRGSVRSGCGGATAASGPFYCPADGTVYLDLSFFDELHQRFGAPGDFAQAYVISHEIGHHVQNQLGIAGQVHDAMARDRANANEYSVRLELQADCFAGIWGHSTAQRKILEEGDVEEGLNAASAIGDDRLQREAGRSANPETFTHGTSAQRVEWFERGLRSGRMSDCDTFGR